MIEWKKNNSKKYAKLSNKHKFIEWMLDYWMYVELLNKYKSIEQIQNYWINIKWLNKYIVTEWT